MFTSQSKEGDDGHRGAVNAPSATLSPPAIALPKGGGAMRGIGEKFAANPVTGTGAMTVPIATSPGRAGFGPQLSLAYDSGSGNGPFGFGWSLSLPSITRKTDKGLPRYLDGQNQVPDSDVFILSGVEDLVPEFKQDAAGNWVIEAGRHVIFDEPRMVNNVRYRVRRYRPRIEGLFARIERWTNQTDAADVFWRSLSKDNMTTWYGKTAESRIADPSDATRIFSWLICESYDDKGNVISYGYREENADKVDFSQAHERNRGEKTDRLRSANRYLKRIRYGNHTPYLPKLLATHPWPAPPGITEQDGGRDWFFEVLFDYGEHDLNIPTPNGSSMWELRNDPFSTYRAGFEVRTYRLCQRVLMLHHFPDEQDVGANCLVRSTDFTYSYEDNKPDWRDPIFAFLVSVTQSGYKRQPGSYRKKSLPPLEFAYTRPTIDETLHEVDPESLENLPYGLDNGRYQWVDLDGEGLSGVLTEQAEGWFYKRNLSPFTPPQEPGRETVSARFAPIERVAHKPSLAALSGGRQQFLDLAGDGQLDLVELAGPTPGFYERTGDGRWETFVPFTSLPNLAWDNPNLKFVDLTGDGHADILISEDEVFCWHPSRAEAGFAPPERVRKALDEEKGPKLVLADGTQSIYLSDMSGDGLTDLVRIRNGEVCYWPNLGYGHFGAKVTMDNAPWFDAPDLFDQRRIRLADIDASGVTDILYLSRRGVQLYFNQSGNSWSAPTHLTNVPATDNVKSITVVDLLGNGTACLVWSSPLSSDVRQPMRYVDLMGGRKPHLLVTTKNNLGAETHVQYAPSTKFYLADKLAGKPWITRLPFLVHVVEHVESRDLVSNTKLVSTYRYRHGYFEGVEREFRGFAYVEQRDAETVVGQFDLPPIVTRTWFHTGAFFEGDTLEAYFKLPENKEYFIGDDQAVFLPDTDLPTDLSADEVREACRALKGSILRQEIYTEDGGTKAELPYSVSERSYKLSLLQPRGRNRHAVFFSHPGETIDYHYERDPADPRISHLLTLEVDDYGNVLKSVAIGYQRRTPAFDEQKQTLATFTEDVYTNPILEADAYRIPLPAESKSYELTSPTIKGAKPLEFSSVSALPPAAAEFAYEAKPTSGQTQKRLIEHVRTLYRKNDLSDLLLHGQLESMALPGESYKLAFTPGLLAQVYQRNAENLLPDLASVLPVDVPGDQVADRGGYADLDGNSHWWIPAGRVFYHPDPGATRSIELAEAEKHFFLPRRYRDPFGKDATITYDSDENNPTKNYDLLMVETRDPVGNVVRAKNDYRVLQPELVTDPNDNRTEVRFDALGMVVGTAVMGKAAGPVEGDSFARFTPDLTPTEIKNFFDSTDPRLLAIDHLGTATSRFVYDLERVSACAASIARETHVSDLAGGQQTKVQLSFVYSDGFGREAQTKIQAEPGPLDPNVPSSPILNPRWVGTGSKAYNNKGKPVRQFEPFFSPTPHFGIEKHGVSSTLFYDPVERVVATLHPHNAWEKVVFDPWQQTTYDVNDTVTFDPKTDKDVSGFFTRLPEVDYLPTWHQARIDKPPGDPERQAADKAAKHANTPTIAHFDTLGRPFLTLAHNGFQPDGTPIQFPTRTTLDIEGNQREVIDAKDRIVMRYDYDLLGTHMHQASMEAGERWMLNDVTGKPIRAWDSRGFMRRMTYDELRRPTGMFVSGNNVTEFLAEQTVYGESQPSPELVNLRGKPYQVRDGAGMATNHEYDFKGNLLKSERQLLQNYQEQVNWRQAPPLEQERFTSHTRYDALNRPVQLIEPHSDRPNTKLNVIQPGYNEANFLERVDVWLGQHTEPTELLVGNTANLHAVTNINYDAKGQRTLIQYGNGAETTYAYDDQTFRLIHLKTTRPAGLNGLALQLFESGTVVQDLRYTYDPAGNITRIADDALPVIVYDNQQVEAVCDYTYDAIYRLIETNGREHIGQTAFQPHPPNGDFRDYPFAGLNASPDDIQALRNYTERYEYDAVGNFEKLIHQAANGSWTRGYTYDEDSLLEPPTPAHPGRKSNRLSSTTVSPTTAETYSYQDAQGTDVNGCMTSINTIRMDWDFEEELTRIDLGGGGTAYYAYDAGGQRVRRLIERTGAGGAVTRVEERIYLGGFEIYREYPADRSGVTLERETLHVMDDKQRIALVETRTKGDDGSPEQLIRYQVSNHLGSASLELDDHAIVISYEEYYPYGSTSYQAVNKDIKTAAKRYRYTGKERDEESGLYYHGARYYAPWLGRWVSCDPAGMADQANVYWFSSANPVRFLDRDGRQSDDPMDNKEAQPPRISDEFLKSLGPERKQSAAELLKEIGALEVDTFLKRSNVAEKGIAENDTELNSARVKTLVRNAAKEFGVNPGLLAEHLLAEPDRQGKTLTQFLNEREIGSANLGLDDFVRDRELINSSVPGASSITYAANAPDFDAKKDELKRGSDPKPQKKFTPEQGVRATAAYIKYKEKIARSEDNLGDRFFEALSPHVKLQLLRLLVNPGPEHQGLGTKHWLELVKSGHAEELFDTRALTASKTKALARRATIHTARAIHISRKFFSVEP